MITSEELLEKITIEDITNILMSFGSNELLS